MRFAHFFAGIASGLDRAASFGAGTPSAHASVGATASDDSGFVCLPSAGTPAPYTRNGTCASYGCGLL